MNVLQQAARQLEPLEALDKVAKPWRGRRHGGKALSLAGLGVPLGGAYLSGHLSFGMGMDVNRTAWE